MRNNKFFQQQKPDQEICIFFRLSRASGDVATHRCPPWNPICHSYRFVGFIKTTMLLMSLMGARSAIYSICTKMQQEKD